MKKMASLLLVTGLMLSGCGTIGVGSGRVNVGVAVGDAGSEQVATVTDKGIEIADAQPVTFTFSTRPGSDAVTIEGYRILSDKIDGVEQVDSSNIVQNAKMNLYVPSGYSCSVRTDGTSCKGTEEDLTPENGQPVQHSIYFASGLGARAAAKGASVSRVTTIEFYGFSANNVPFTKTVSGIVSRGTLITETN